MEHDGTCRHGDGRPAATRWYPRTAAVNTRASGERAPVRAGGDTGSRSEVGVAVMSEETSERVAQLRVGPVVDRRRHPDEVIASGGEPRSFDRELVHHRSESASDPVPDHSRSHRTWDGEPNSRALRGIRAGDQPDRPSARSFAFTRQALEGGATREPLDHAERRARPFWRRARITARPPRVLMRERKPCFFARLRTFG